MTLKARLLWAMGLVAALLLLSSFVVTRTTTDHLVAQLDRQLERFARPAGGASSLPPQPNMGPRPDQASTDEERNFSTLFIGVFDGDTLVTLVAPNGAASSGAVPDLDRATAEELADGDGIVSVGSDIDTTSYRAVARTEPSGDLTVFAVPLDDVSGAIDRLVAVQVGASAAVLIVLALVTWWVLRLGVRPIRRMTTAATDVAGGDLSRRIPDAPSGTEAAELGGALNTMLERIETAFAERAASQQRLRQFVADASHELRTPVTTIRGYAELYRVGGLSDPDQLDAAMTRTEAEAVRMGRLVQDLLELARLDQGRRPPTGAVALDEVVQAVVADAQVVHPERSLAVHSVPVQVDGVDDQLHQVVANLVTNAVVHTPHGAHVDVDLARDASGDAVLRVADDGPGMSPEVAARAFERFYRADPSRSRDSGGSGLGLSIVASIVAAHHGTVEIEPAAAGSADAPPRGTCVVVHLPTRAR